MAKESPSVTAEPGSTGTRPSTQATPGRGGGAGFRFIDPAALMRIKNLQMRSRMVVEGFDKGIHRSPYHGFSAEFSEYRQYTPGDDPRYLDWRLYGRSDRYFIKKFEDETNLRCQIVLDASRSMGYGSGGVTKWEYARTAAATIAYFLSRQRDAVGLARFDDRMSEYLPARTRPGHLSLVMAALQREPAGRASDPKGPMRELVQVSHRRGFFVILSDLLFPAPAWKTALGDLRAAGHEVMVIRVLDPREIDFAFDQATRFRDIETGQEIFLDPAQARQQYLARFGEHAEQLRQACLGVGADWEQVATDRPLELLLYDWIRARMRKGPAAPRRNQSASASSGGGP